MEYLYGESGVNREEWSRFVNSHPYGNIFQTPEMYDVYKGTKNFEPVVIACAEGGKIKGLLSTSVISEKGGFTGWLTRRSIVVGAPLLSGGVNAGDFIKRYDSYIKDKCLYSRIANLFDLREELKPLILRGYEYFDHLNYLIDLSAGDVKLWENLHDTRKRQVKRGYKRGITVKIHDTVEDLREYYKILELTYRKNKIPLHDYSMFESAYRILSPKGYIKFFSAYDGDTLIGHRIILLYKKNMFYWYAGSLPEAGSMYPNDVLVWEILKWGANNGFEVFDFGGAGYPDKEYGVRDFKKKFGGTEVCYGNYLKIHQPLKYKLLRSAVYIYGKINK
jgi:lipid II:glycine glycyltransferase (peptidoglycan interpeptide bridge formation enzyme)